MRKEYNDIEDNGPAIRMVAVFYFVFVLLSPDVNRGIICLSVKSLLTMLSCRAASSFMG